MYIWPNIKGTTDYKRLKRKIIHIDNFDGEKYIDTSEDRKEIKLGNRNLVGYD